MSISDMDRALEMFGALGLGATSDSLSVLTIPGAPWSKSRPRFSRGRAYSPKEDVDAESRSALYMKQAVRQPLTGNVGLACIFFRPNRQRIDTDNLIKHVCDAANGVLWLDDSQCTAVMGVIELDPENPRTVIALGEHVSTLRRGTSATNPCTVCAKPIPMDGHGGKPPKTCSVECRQAAKGYPDLSDPVPCPECATPFRRATRTSKYCSQECAVAARTSRQKAVSVPFSQCSDCGIYLSHRRGGRCRDCWRISKKAVTP